MSIPNTMVFIDGENLVFRYQAMLDAGRRGASGVVHAPDVFVWHPGLLSACGLVNVTRVYMYTSMVGDDAALRTMKERIAGITYTYEYATDYSGTAQVVPVVFKKAAKSHKSRQVDIHITIDMMRFAYTESVDLLYLLSGDGDFSPLVQEVMRRGKQVIVGAVSSGLTPDLRHSVDEFVDLDNLLFSKPRAKRASKKTKAPASKR